jgi:hypothetical protein
MPRVLSVMRLRCCQLPCQVITEVVVQRADRRESGRLVRANIGIVCGPLTGRCFPINRKVVTLENIMGRSSPGLCHIRSTVEHYLEHTE